MYSNIVEFSQKPKTKLSAKTVNGFNPLAVLAKKTSFQVSDGFHLRLDIYAHVYKYMRASGRNIFHVKPTLTRKVRQSLHGQFLQFHFFFRL